MHLSYLQPNIRHVAIGQQINFSSHHQYVYLSYPYSPPSEIHETPFLVEGKPPTAPLTMAPVTADGSSSRGKDPPSTSGIKKGCLSFTTSMLEYIRYIKAFVVGQAKKMTARSEEEAAEADLQASKTEVEAADAAEHTKKKALKL